MEKDIFTKAVIKKDTEFFLHDFLMLFGKFWEKIWATPFLWAGQQWKETAEKNLEPVARLIGRMAGELLYPFFSKNLSHPLEPALFITRVVENSTSIRGEDFYLSEKKVIRRVYECPFKDKPEAKILCHLGEAIGQEVFSQVVPGSRHKVHQTMAKGSAYCEYSYVLDND